MNEVAERKARIKERLAWGDMLKASNLAGVHPTTFGEWFSKKRPSGKDVEYLQILEQVVRSREEKFNEAASRVEEALG